MWRYTYHRFTDRAAFLAALGAAGWVLGAGDTVEVPGAAITVLGVLREVYAGEVDADGEPVSPPELPGFHVLAAWATAVEPDAFAAAALPATDAPVWFADVPREPPPPPRVVPAEVTNFQARAALMRRGMFAAVDAALHGAGGEALQAWEYANTVARQGALVLAMAAQLGLDGDALDDLFIEAAEIVA